MLPTSVPPRTITPRDALLIIIISVFFGLLLIATQNENRVFNEDFAWYLNRAQLLSEGITAQGFIYTFGYPFLLGLVNRIFDFPIVSAIVLNITIFALTLLGIFYLGTSYYNRTIGWLAIVLVATHSSMIFFLRQMQTFPLFMLMIVLILVVHRRLILRPSIIGAITLGMLIGMSMYVRFEGVIYAALIGLAFLQLGKVHGWQVSFRVTLIAATACIPFVFFYLSMLFSGTISSGNDTFLGILRSSASLAGILHYVSVAVAQSLHSAIWLWTPFVLIPYVWAVLHTTRDDLLNHFFFSGLVLYHAGCLFILTRYNFTITYFLPLVPLSALLIAWAIQWWALRIRFKGAFAGLLLLAIMPSLIQWLPSITITPFGYLTGDLVDDAKAIDQWLLTTGNPRVYTACRRVLPLTQSDMVMLYRFGGYEIGAEDLPDSPPVLMPFMAENGDLFMDCGESSAVDWNNYAYNERENPDYDLVPFYTYNGSTTYIFSRVERRP